MKINGAWEIKSKQKAICRWLVAWDEISKEEVAGAVAGFAGGGAFVVERFYAKLSGGKLSALWIDFTDTISGEEIEFERCGERALALAEEGLDAVWEWNSNDEWSDSDEVTLLPAKRASLRVKKEMLYLESDVSPIVREVCVKAGLTAGPG